MINQFEATDVLLHDLPELSGSFPAAFSSASISIYQTIQAFVKLTCQQVAEHNYTAAKRCFALADRLYEQGNYAVKCAIENVFVFSLDSIFNQAKKERMEIRGLVPGSLYSLYMQQVNHGGC